MDFETLLNSDLIFFNFDPSNPDPETLFNFGILSTSFAWNKRRVCFVVCCPKEYPYSLNIEFVCKNNPIVYFNQLPQAIDLIREEIKNYTKLGNNLSCLSVSDKWVW